MTPPHPDFLDFQHLIDTPSFCFSVVWRVRCTLNSGTGQCFIYVFVYFQGMLTSLLMHEPEEPVDFLIKYLKTDNADGESKGGGGSVGSASDNTSTTSGQ